MGKTGAAVRPAGRERLLIATEACLNAGNEVRIADICKEADVSAALIYKYFIDREDLVAEAYARIFKGLVATDLAAIAHFPTDLELLRIAIREQAKDIFSAERDQVRWARLEALAHARMNPGIAERIDQARYELVTAMAEAILNFDGVVLNRKEAETLGVIALGMILGATAMSPEQMDDDQRHRLADMWSTMVYSTLANTRV
ncbi:MAG: TetR/AcrR family transcriptional regulator [Candidatus Nanopelagicales bacterium]|nr:TetR/AcrR family transcriptional regulator [Candidatus Nanopelagicales bacterium]